MTVRGLFSVLAISAVLVGALGCKAKLEVAARVNINDLPAVYASTGFKECGYDSVWKGEHSGAVRLEGDDLNRAVEFLKPHFKGDIAAVLYVNAPEAKEEQPGQPALLPLRQESGTYCAVGLSGSYSLPLFLEFQKKYQNQIQ